jgi:hypothetical protein
MVLRLYQVKMDLGAIVLQPKLYVYIHMTFIYICQYSIPDNNYYIDKL